MYGDFNKVNEDSGISARDVLNKIDQFEVYSRYLGEYPQFNKQYFSPFQEEKTPSFSIYQKGANVLFKCFSSGKHGDCIELVKALEGVDVARAIAKILQPLNHTPKSFAKLPNRKVAPVAEERLQLLTVTQDFNATDLEYWMKHTGATEEDLKFFDVKACKEVWVKKGNDESLFARYRIADPIYRYRFNGRTKVYRPKAKNKKDKFRNDNKPEDYQGFEQLPESGYMLVITKAYKDVICLKKFGIYALAPQAESNYIPPKVIEYLRGRFKKIIIFYDNDAPGKEMAKRRSEELDIPYVYIPEYHFCKDISECRALYGEEYAKNVMIEILKPGFKNEQ